MVRTTAVPAGSAASAGPPWLSSTAQSIAAVIASIFSVRHAGEEATAAIGDTGPR